MDNDTLSRSPERGSQKETQIQEVMIEYGHYKRARPVPEPRHDRPIRHNAKPFGRQNAFINSAVEGKLRNPYAREATQQWPRNEAMTTNRVQMERQLKGPEWECNQTLPFGMTSQNGLGEPQQK